MRPSKNTTTKNTNTTEKRTRSCQVKFRLSPKEHSDLMAQLKSTGMTTQDFLLKAVKNAPIIDADSRKLILETYKSVKDCQLQLKGIGININQMAKVANSNGDLPREREFTNAAAAAIKVGKEVSSSCQSLSPLIKPPPLKLD